MDTIIYVSYRDIQSDTKRSDKMQSGAVRVERFMVGQELQVVQLTVCEVIQEAQTWAGRMLESCFPKLRARRQQKLRDGLMGQIRAELLPYLDDEGEKVCLYARRTRGNTETEKGAWLREALKLPMPEDPMAHSMELKWLRPLLTVAKNEHFLALGTTGCIRQVFMELAPRIKSLLWIVPDYTYKAQVEEIAEFLYEEYGLAVDLRFLPEGAVFARVQINGKYLTEPLNVLDFTGEKYVPSLTLQPGSVWLDASAMEEKEKRIKGRRMPVEYISLRTLAEHPESYTHE